jgi:hypothetical protein
MHGWWGIGQRLVRAVCLSEEDDPELAGAKAPLWHEFHVGGGGARPFRWIDLSTNGPLGP